MDIDAGVEPARTREISRIRASDQAFQPVRFKKLLEVPILVTTRVIPRILGSYGVVVPPACHREMGFVSSAVLLRMGHFQGYFRVLNTAMDKERGHALHSAQQQPET